MARQIYFEILAPGMKAKLDASYRISNNHNHVSNAANFLREFSPSSPKAGFLGDAIPTHSRLR